MKNIKILVLIITVIGLVLILFFFFALPNKNDDVQYKIIELSSTNAKSKIYIKRKVWGMTSDNQLVIISTSNKKEFTSNVKRDYIYEGLMPLFYKLHQDTLSIYTLQKSTIPNEIKTSFIIVQMELNNPAMMDLIKNDNYKNKGLIKIN